MLASFQAGLLCKKTLFVWGFNLKNPHNGIRFVEPASQCNSWLWSQAAAISCSFQWRTGCYQPDHHPSQPGAGRLPWRVSQFCNYFPGKVLAKSSFLPLVSCLKHWGVSLFHCSFLDKFLENMAQTPTRVWLPYGPTACLFSSGWTLQLRRKLWLVRNHPAGEWPDRTRLTFRIFHCPVQHLTVGWSETWFGVQFSVRPKARWCFFSGILETYHQEALFWIYLLHHHAPSIVYQHVIINRKTAAPQPPSEVSASAHRQWKLASWSSWCCFLL